jgi:hypothetical protein
MGLENQLAEHVPTLHAYHKKVDLEIALHNVSNTLAVTLLRFLEKYFHSLHTLQQI